MLDEKVACAIVSSHLYSPSYIHVQGYPPLWQPRSDFGDFNHGVGQVMKITILKVGAFTQAKFPGLSPGARLHRLRMYFWLTLCTLYLLASRVE